MVTTTTPSITPTIARTYHYLGIDISKDTFNAALLIDLIAVGKKAGQATFKDKLFDSNPKGFAALLDWLQNLHVQHFHAFTEPTGVYGDALAGGLRGITQSFLQVQP